MEEMLRGRCLVRVGARERGRRGGKEKVDAASWQCVSLVEEDQRRIAMLPPVIPCPFPHALNSGLVSRRNSSTSTTSIPSIYDSPWRLDIPYKTAPSSARELMISLSSTVALEHTRCCRRDLPPTNPQVRQLRLGRSLPGHLSCPHTL